MNFYHLWLFLILILSLITNGKTCTDKEWKKCSSSLMNKNEMGKENNKEGEYIIRKQAQRNIKEFLNTLEDVMQMTLGILLAMFFAAYFSVAYFMFIDIMLSRVAQRRKKRKREVVMEV